MVMMIAYLSVDVGGSIKFVGPHTLVGLTRRVDPPVAGPWFPSRSVERTVAGRVHVQVVRSRESMPTLAISSNMSSLSITSSERLGLCHLVCVSCRSARRRPPSR